MLKKYKYKYIFWHIENIDEIKMCVGSIEKIK